MRGKSGMQPSCKKERVMKKIVVLACFLFLTKPVQG
jgi:hypothetical protein